MEPVERSTESPRRLVLLVGLAAVLAGILLWTRWDDWTTRLAAPSAAAPEAHVPQTVDIAAGPAGERQAGRRQGAHPLAGLALAELHDTVRRPLFEKGRRPVKPPPKKRAAPVKAAPPAPAPRRVVNRDALTLMGVLTKEDGGAIALLRRKRTGESVRLQEGEAIDGWTVERVEIARVLLRQGDTQIVLELFRGD